MNNQLKKIDGKMGFFSLLHLNSRLFKEVSEVVNSTIQGEEEKKCNKLTPVSKITSSPVNREKNYRLFTSSSS